MAESRSLRIARAKKMLYDNNDRVKALNSSLLLSEVLDERVAQIQYKNTILGFLRRNIFSSLL